MTACPWCFVTLNGNPCRQCRPSRCCDCSDISSTFRCVPCAASYIDRLRRAAPEVATPLAFRDPELHAAMSSLGWLAADPVITPCRSCGSPTQDDDLSGRCWPCERQVQYREELYAKMVEATRVEEEIAKANELVEMLEPDSNETLGLSQGVWA